MEQARRELPDIEYCEDPYACVRGADALVIVTEWAQFRALDLQRLKRETAQPVVVDLRNIYRPDDMAALGFIYESVGRRRTSQIKIVELEPGRSRVAPKLLKAKVR
jgi:UDPglucose 6-dehydrogenase